MVVFDVMVEVGVPSVPHQWIRDVGEEGVKDDKTTVENPTHVYMLVHHQGVCAHVVELHCEMKQAVDPRESPEEKHGTWDRRNEVEQ